MYCYAPNGEPTLTNQCRPLVVRDARGNPVVGVADADLPRYGWYPESRLPKRVGCDYALKPTVDAKAGVAKYQVSCDWKLVQKALWIKFELRLNAELATRIAVATTGLEPPPDDPIDVIRKQLDMLMQASLLVRREGSGVVTADETATLDLLSEIPAEVLALRQRKAEIAAWVLANVDEYDYEWYPNVKEWPEGPWW